MQRNMQVQMFDDVECLLINQLSPYAREQFDQIMFSTLSRFLFNNGFHYRRIIKLILNNHQCQNRILKSMSKMNGDCDDHGITQPQNTQ